MLEPQAFEDVKAFLDDIIAYAVVTVDGEEIKCPIHRRERMKDGRVAVYIQITPEESRSVTVQKVQLYNKNRQLWAGGKGFFWKKPRKGFCTASHLSFWNRRCKPCTQKNSGLTM